MLLPAKTMSHGPRDYITYGLCEPLLSIFRTTVLTLPLIFPCLYHSKHPVVLSSFSFAPRNLSFMSPSVHAVHGNRGCKCQAPGRYCEWVKWARIRNEILFLSFLLKHVVLLVYLSLSHFDTDMSIEKCFFSIRRMCCEPDNKWAHSYHSLGIGKETEYYNQGHVQSKWDSPLCSIDATWNMNPEMLDLSIFLREGHQLFKHRKNFKDSIYCPNTYVDFSRGSQICNLFLRHKFDHVNHLLRRYLGLPFPIEYGPRSLAQQVRTSILWPLPLPPSLSKISLLSSTLWSGNSKMSLIYCIHKPIAYFSATCASL